MKSSKLVKGCLEALILLLSNMTEIKKIYRKNLKLLSSKEDFSSVAQATVSWPVADRCSTDTQVP